MLRAVWPDVPVERALARRSQLSGEPASGICSHWIDGSEKLLGTLTSGALERVLVEASLAGRDPRQAHPVLAGRAHWTIADATHTLRPPCGDHRLQGTGCR